MTTIGVDGLAIAIAAAAGIAVGTATFAGLWWTLARVRGARRPAAWLLTSFALRAAFASAAFLAVARHGMLPLLAAFAGFLLARALLVRLWGRST